jgi:hypothetical protein
MARAKTVLDVYHVLGLLVQWSCEQRTGVVQAQRQTHRAHLDLPTSPLKYCTPRPDVAGAHYKDGVLKVQRKG